jgi:hypothetical protein
MAITMMERQEDGAYQPAISHEGAVLGTYERNMRDDSDFHAIYWNPEKQEPGDTIYATTRGWTYENHATVDATPEVWTEFHEFLAGRLKALILDRVWREARTIEIGKEVVVIKGRKITRGTIGRVVWQGMDSYNPKKKRIGIETPDGEKLFTAASNVEIDSEYLPDYVDYDRIEKADQEAKKEAEEGGVARYRGLSASAITASY